MAPPWEEHVEKILISLRISYILIIEKNLVNSLTTF